MNFLLKYALNVKKYIGNNKREKNIESYLVQERLGKKMCRHYCKQTLREALFFFVGFPVAKTPKSTGNSATHDSPVHEEHVSRLSITAMNGCWVCEVFLQFLDFSAFKNNKWLKKWTYLKLRINLSAKLWILIVNNNVFSKILIGLAEKAEGRRKEQRTRGSQ